MAIQWFPGHMHLTKKAIIQRLKDIDVVIELLDARLPGSSANPMLAQLTGIKPKLKILNKQDLADPARTEQWLAHYNSLPATRAIGLDASETAPAQRLIKVCRELVPGRGGMAKPVRVLICGIPNVGKSTLINTLKGKRAAKTGDEPGITKLEQRIVLADDFYLFDTPGMLWPRISVEKSGYNLAASGAVGRNAFDEEEVALEVLNYVRLNYPGQIEARFKLADISALDDEDLLTEIGKKRGAVLSGGRIHRQKAGEIVINEYRSTGLGRISLETPEEFAVWWAAGVAADAERARKKSKGKKGSSSRDEEADDESDDALDDADE